MHICGATSSVELARAVLARLPMKRRRDAVVCIEYLITASPEAFKRHGGTMPDTGGYFDQAMTWLSAYHGGANIVCAELHLDERTPHLVAYITPLTQDGRLSARDFLGGPTTLRKMQTDFHHSCGKPFGLARGIKGSMAQHQAIRRYYQGLNVDQPHLMRSDLAAAALGLHTKRYKDFENWVRASAIRYELEVAAQKALKARQATLNQKALALERWRIALENRELEVEQRLDRLGDIDAALSLALRDAEMEKERANLLSIQIETMRRLECDAGKAPERTGLHHQFR